MSAIEDAAAELDELPVGLMEIDRERMRVLSERAVDAFIAFLRSQFAFIDLTVDEADIGQSPEVTGWMECLNDSGFTEGRFSLCVGSLCWGTDEDEDILFFSETELLPDDFQQELDCVRSCMQAPDERQMTLF